MHVFVYHMYASSKPPLMISCIFSLQTIGPTWQVPTGRRDGRVSLATDAANLPGFTDSIDVQKQKFAAKGLNTQDLVTLVGKQLTQIYILFTTVRYNINMRLSSL